ncbi:MULTISPECIES: hypothetical protein [Sporosarcina]|uniref:hypothetical protein n=1 Tax=Sporosarcina TaxID=1569 RepID=UPI0005914E18|nr:MULTISPECIES: hypothetical protein [Sporosarcina]WJY27309.1 hypothetical protein QWT68_14905 [Sporosarcina sp. 0.2-SM1T-5]
MKYVIGLFAVFAASVFVNLVSEFVLNGAYSAIASWLIVMLFLLGVVFFANARYFLGKEETRH